MEKAKVQIQEGKKQWLKIIILPLQMNLTEKRPSITEKELTPIVLNQLQNTKKHKVRRLILLKSGQGRQPIHFLSPQDELRKARRGSAPKPEVPVQGEKITSCLCGLFLSQQYHLSPFTLLGNYLSVKLGLHKHTGPCKSHVTQLCPLCTLSLPSHHSSSPFMKPTSFSSFSQRPGVRFWGRIM